jgi:predicted enzyme related to lactoylglutathione lyase
MEDKWRQIMIPTIQAVTIAVSNLAASKHFYEDILGFEVDAYYEPTRWQSYKSEGRAYFCIIEDSELEKMDHKSLTNFDVENLENLWLHVKEQCDIESKLEKTPWGSYKFVIRDPDGNRLGFCQKS